ncbi:class I SAM-dependent methyltransferase [Vibrio salinus]|uniref:class I SAM-dependent methyltransferase n=1 Tax=Vibrio salinus TaxID=2899784 RepID=UPI001E639358|nr:class I SAM-dependent methyltransferase [Vibrio salinus]MCE0492435.1 hypothetical protein [Vibrio salinus]
MLADVKDEKKTAYNICPDEFIFKNHHLIPSNKVLLINDCNCNNSIFLAKRGFDVTTLCHSKYAVRKSKQITNSNQTSVNYICSDPNDFDLGKDNWDAIISLFCHLSPISRQSFHHRLAQALRSKGIYITENCVHIIPNETRKPIAPLEQPINVSSIRNELSQLQISHIQELEKEIKINNRKECKAQIIQAVAFK